MTGFTTTADRGDGDGTWASAIATTARFPRGDAMRLPVELTDSWQNGTESPVLSVKRPTLNRVSPETHSITSTVAQWEGTVDALDDENMTARLRPLSLAGNAAPDRSDRFDEWATIPIAQIDDSDRSLAKPGAIFYMSVVKAKRQGWSLGGTSVVIIFRKVPVWHRNDIKQVHSRASSLFKRIHDAIEAAPVEPQSVRPRFKSAYNPNAISITIRK